MICLNSLNLESWYGDGNTKYSNPKMLLDWQTYSKRTTHKALCYTYKSYTVTLCNNLRSIELRDLQIPFHSSYITVSSISHRDSDTIKNNSPKSASLGSWFPPATTLKLLWVVITATATQTKTDHKKQPNTPSYTKYNIQNPLRMPLIREKTFKESTDDLCTRTSGLNGPISHAYSLPFYYLKLATTSLDYYSSEHSHHMKCSRNTKRIKIIPDSNFIIRQVTLEYYNIKILETCFPRNDNCKHINPQK